MEVRHILVEKHGQAAAILADIDSGKISFNEAAREHSVCVMSVDVIWILSVQ